MKIKNNYILFFFILSFALTYISSSAEAALSSKYESQASGSISAGTKPIGNNEKQPPAVKPGNAAAIKTVPITQPPVVNASSSGTAKIVFRKDLKAKQLELIKKEHAIYCKAFIDAEMGLRYFYKTQYDAKYRGAKAPTEEELKAMRFELSLLMKDLGSSAKRYGRNIKMVRIAMGEMEEDERTLFAIALSQILATPAYAVDAGSLAGIEAGMNSVANATSDVGLSTAADYASAAMSEAQMAKAGEVAASAVSLASTVALAGAAIVGGAALTMGAVTTGAAVVGGAVVVGAIVGGGLETVDGVIGFIDSLTEQTTDTKNLKKIKTAVNVINVTSGAQKGQMIKVVIDGIDGTKDIWIPKIFDATEKSDCPGKDGVNKVKNAKKNASSSGRGGGGGG
ncbi:MAG: hypothetical protein PHO18_00440 [Synergistaceae bacterium]|nr:hypothetical protein [Synergistaceae bacterium]